MARREGWGGGVVGSVCGWMCEGLCCEQGCVRSSLEECFSNPLIQDLRALHTHAEGSSDWWIEGFNSPPEIEGIDVQSSPCLGLWVSGLWRRVCREGSGCGGVSPGQLAPPLAPSLINNLH